MQIIWIVEDDEDIRDIVLYALRSAGYEAAGFETGAALFAALEAGSSPDMLLLDIMLPGDDGLALLRKLRSMSGTKATPVIILSAKGSEMDKIKGLDLGADDYVAKPFGVMELLSRIAAVLRRSGISSPGKQGDVLCYRDITLDNARRAVSAGETKISLTYKEYELLHYLLLNAGLVMTRERIMQAVWGYDIESESRTLDMHIRSLRHKLGASGELIVTVRNVGYRLGE